MPFIYMPEWKHAEFLVENYGPRNGTLEQDRDRTYLLIEGYIAMQVQSVLLSDPERSLSYEDVMRCLKRRPWALLALLAPLPDRPPLLHRGCEPCSFESCSSTCLGDECVCTTGKQYPETEFRICLNR